MGKLYATGSTTGIVMKIATKTKHRGVLPAPMQPSLFCCDCLSFKQVHIYAA